VGWEEIIMAKIGRKVEGKNILGDFAEISIQGLPKKQRRIVVQKNDRDWKHPWYIYDVNGDLITTVGWSMDKNKAITKANKYIREEIKVK
jgi:hypothetical protein